MKKGLPLSERLYRKWFWFTVISCALIICIVIGNWARKENTRQLKEELCVVPKDGPS